MNNKSIGYQELYLDANFKSYKILSLEIAQKQNIHAVANLTGILEETEEKAIYDIHINTGIKIMSKNNNKVIFSGVPTKVKVKHINSIYYYWIEITSYSILLDFKAISRSFQNKENEYKNIFKKIIVEEHKGFALDVASKERIQGASIIQYEETDWEFIKRMASHLEAQLIVGIKTERPEIAIGIPDGNIHKEENYNHWIEKNVKDYLSNKANYGEWKEEDLTSYIVESTEDYEIGDKIKYKSIEFAVSEKRTELIKGILTHEYRLQKIKGLRGNIYYNDKIEGMSIDGMVVEVEKDRLKLHLSIDENQEVEKAYWYQFDSGYTSEGTTGWYCMPEVEDNVKLYMPNKDERKAYVKRVNRLDGEENVKTQDPTIKYFGTIDGKELCMSPNELRLSTTEDIIHMKMSHEEGIEILSDNDIVIKSSKTIYGECETMEVKSGDKIEMDTGKASIIIDEIVHIKG